MRSVSLTNKSCSKPIPASQLAKWMWWKEIARHQLNCKCRMPERDGKRRLDATAEVRAG